MTQLDNNVLATDLDDTLANAQLSAQGYTVRHFETWHVTGTTCIIWDAPAITEADLPY